jgi:hypothetical protein
MIVPSILNLIGWKKDSKKMVIVAIILYFLTLNALSLLLCVIGILWDSNNEFDTQEKKKNPLLIIAGVLCILVLLFWFVPIMKKADGSSGPLSLFTAMVSGTISSELLAFKVIGINYAISLPASFIIAIAISFFGKLRNNSKKVPIAAISYIISFSIPSAILCFIAYAKMKKQEQKQNKEVCMFCSNCGSKVEDGVRFCPGCGKAIDSVPNGSGASLPPYQSTVTQGTVGAKQVSEQDKPSTGFWVLGCLIPIVGLILYLTWKDKTPLKAKSCGQGALVGFIIEIVFYVIGFLL